MTATQAPPRGDYVPGPGRKKGLSRGRKGLIGFLVVAAAGAAAGGGTFASFTASTDNQAGTAGEGFTVDNTMDLGNSVLTNTSSAPGTDAVQCVASTGTFNAIDCSVLFGDDDIAAMGSAPYVAGVALENLGTDPGKLLLGSLGCAPESPADDLCDDISLTIQEVADPTTDGRGTGATPFVDETGFNTLENVVSGGSVTAGDALCVFPFSSAAACTAGDLLSNLPEFSTADPPVVIEASMEATDNSTNVGIRYFKITAELNAPDNTACPDTAPADGLDDGTGVGCHNELTGNAQFTLRWVLQEI